MGILWSMDNDSRCKVEVMMVEAWEKCIQVEGRAGVVKVKNEKLETQTGQDLRSVNEQFP